MLAIAAGAACSQSYAEASKPADDAGAEAGTADATAEAAVDADLAGDVVPPAPTFTVLASGLGTLGGIAATETAVYFIVAATHTLSTVAIGGGAVSPVPNMSNAPSAVVAFGAELFWSDPAGTLGRVSLLDDAVLTVSAGPGTSPVALAAGVGGLAVLARMGPGVGSVLQYDLGLVAGSGVSGLADPYDVTLSGATVYWTESSGRVGQGTLGGSTNAEVATGETGCESIAANAAGLYWTRPKDGLVRMTVLTTAATGTLTANETSPSSIAVDDSDVYWLTGDGRLRRKRIGQELPPATLASGFPSVFAGTHVRAIALTSKYIVWLTTDGRILRTDK